MRVMSRSAPTIGADGTVYIGSLDNKLYALDMKGHEKWQFKANDSINSTPAIGADGTVYIGSYDKRLYAIDPENGKEKWHFEAKDIVSSPAIGADGTVYVGSYDMKLYAINPNNGKENWHFDTKGMIMSSPVIGADGTIYVGSYDTKLYAIKPDGNEKWEKKTGDAIGSSPAIGADGTVYVGSNDKKLYALDPKDGSQKWESIIGDAVYMPAVGADGTIYVGSYNKLFFAINPENGKEKWRLELDGTVFAPAIGADGTIYAGFSNKLYAIKPNRDIKWNFATNGIAFSAAVGPDGAVYVGAVGMLYAIGKVSVTGVSLNKTELTLKTGQSETLQAAVAPGDATYQELTWSSGDPTIAKVDDSGKVTGVSPGKTTITVTAEDGGYYKQCIVTVTEADKPITIPAPPTPEISLSDIGGHWAKAAIIQAVEKGIVEGYPDGTFKPDRNVTRAEFAVMLKKALKPSGTGAELAFVDKDAIGSWAVKEIAQLVELGIINGYPDGTFLPNKTINHAEMITMVVRAGNLPTTDNAATGYLDNAAIPDYARSNVAAAELYSIPSYIADNKFKPDEQSTRAESVTAILNMLKVKK